MTFRSALIVGAGHGLSAALALFSGTFLWRHQGSPAGMPAPSAVEVRSMEPYLPRTSVWPLIVGVAAALCLNGPVVGWPYAVPGVVVLALGIVGWVGQSRRRA